MMCASASCTTRPVWLYGTRSPPLVRGGSRSAQGTATWSGGLRPARVGPRRGGRAVGHVGPRVEAAGAAAESPGGAGPQAGVAAVGVEVPAAAGGAVPHRAAQAGP